MPKPLTAEHRDKIAASMRRYHAGCRKKICKCPPGKGNKSHEDDVKKRSRRRYPPTKAGQALAKSLKRAGPLKRLRKAGTKKPKKAKAAKPTADMEAYMRQMLSLKASGRVGAGGPKKKKKRRVALTKAARPKTKMTQRSLTSGQVSEYRAVRRLGKKSKKLRGKDAAPDLAFSIGGMYADA